MIPITPEEALAYHCLDGKPGKVSVTPTKPMATQRDLSLAYTPGVAVPVLAIEKDPQLAYQYTSKANLVAVVSNGTAILGLGDRGALASKPVMEGKGVLFKRFADIDVFDIEVDTKDPDELIAITAAIAPTFGGINLEDIKSPECFYVEEKLKAKLNIPVFHDDQHGTAIILAAGLINSLELTNRKMSAIKVVFSGAGAAAIACAKMLLRMGVLRENIFMCDSAGLIHTGRASKLFAEKAAFANGDRPASLADVLTGADVFIGLSVANLVTEEMVRTLANKPIIFALANPNPEIDYAIAKAVRPDAIVATGRSDCPNQINNVLGFPFIFRGALDVYASNINEEMKLAAAKALADLTREDVPVEVLKAYGMDTLEFGTEYIVPKPFDARVIEWESPAVAQAAMLTGVARKLLKIEDYKQQLSNRL